MDLKDHTDVLQEEMMAQSEPLPAQPPVPMWHQDYKLWRDSNRLRFLRIKQHLDIIAALTDEQRQHVQTAGKVVLRDTKLLASVANATRLRGREYMELEVRDCLATYLEYREMGRRMLFWSRELGKPLPAGGKIREEVMKAMAQLEARDWLMHQLEARVGPEACALHRVRGWAGDQACCPHTTLPYRHCCGGRPMPMKLLSVYVTAHEEGLDFGSREFARRVRAAMPQTKLQRRPKPLNHLLPPREGSLRLTRHDRVVRQAMRQQVEPKFDKTLASTWMVKRESRA